MERGKVKSVWWGALKGFPEFLQNKVKNSFDLFLQLVLDKNGENLKLWLLKWIYSLSNEKQNTTYERNYSIFFYLFIYLISYLFIFGLIYHSINKCTSSSYTNAGCQKLPHDGMSQLTNTNQPVMDFRRTWRQKKNPHVNLK